MVVGTSKAASLVCYLGLVCVVMLAMMDNSQVNGTMAKKSKKKKTKENKPPGVAMDNKNFPTNCQLCRLMVEEMEKILSGEGDVQEELSEEQKKKKKRRERRKTRQERNRDRSMPMFVAIEDVCDKMLEYVPQVRKKKFRYIKKSDLSGTQVIMMSQIDGNEAGDELQHKFDQFRHPETNRLMAQCDDLINRVENDLLQWQQTEERPDLYDYLCRERFFGPKDDDKCFAEESAKKELWKKTFDVVLENRPDLREANFDV